MLIYVGHMIIEDTHSKIYVVQIRAVKPTWGAGASFTLRKKVNATVQGIIFINNSY